MKGDIPLKAFFAAVAVATASIASAAENDVLYWMVGAGSTVTKEDGTAVTISDFFTDPEVLGQYGGGADSYFAARVRVTGGDIAGDTFLSLYGEDENGAITTFSGDLGIDFDDSSGVWGAGVPDGNQSPSGGYSAGTPEYAFVIELGNVYDGAWTTVAKSATSTYSQLSDYISPAFGLEPISGKAWSPTQFVAVPEPSGGLLTLLGAAILALRRRRA